MKLNDIIEEWAKDSVLDRSNLSVESGRTAQLHSKYYNMLIIERLALKKLTYELKQLEVEKREFYTQGPFKGDERGWKLPACGQILKSDIPMYLDADNDIISLKTKIDIQTEKVNALLEYIKQINERQWNIRNIITWEKFMAGENS